MLVRVGVSTALMAASWPVHGTFVLPMLGLSLSIGSLAGAAHVWSKLRAVLPPDAGDDGGSPGIRVLAASLIMLAPATATVWIAGRISHGHLFEVATILIAAAVGIATYLGLQSWWRAPELRWLRGSVAP